MCKTAVIISSFGLGKNTQQKIQINGLKFLFLEEILCKFLIVEEY